MRWRSLSTNITVTKVYSMPLEVISLLNRIIYTQRAPLYMDQLIQKCPSRPQCHLPDIPYLPFHGEARLSPRMPAGGQSNGCKSLGKFGRADSLKPTGRAGHHYLPINIFLVKGCHRVPRGSQRRRRKDPRGTRWHSEVGGKIFCHNHKSDPSILPL